MTDYTLGSHIEVSQFSGPSHSLTIDKNSKRRLLVNITFHQHLFHVGFLNLLFAIDYNAPDSLKKI